MNIRCATLDDIVNMQHCNLLCLAENYKIKYYYYIILSWLQLSYIAENDKGSCVGYVLSKMDDEESKQGHIISLAVKRRYRQFGLARKLMSLSMQTMVDCFQAECVYLNVRKSNHVAFDLYSSLGFKIVKVKQMYYADGEDGYYMRKDFIKEIEKQVPVPPCRSPNDAGNQNNVLVLKKFKIVRRHRT